MSPTTNNFYSDHPILKRFWHPIALSRDLGTQPCRVELLGEAYALARLAGGPILTADRCPHRGACWSAGRMFDDGIACPYHGLRLGSDGALRWPSSAIGDPIGRVPVFKVLEVGGIVWARLSDEGDELPPAIMDPTRFADVRTIHLPPQSWCGSAAQLLDNIIDYAHFPHVHAESFAGEDGEAPPAVVLSEQYGFRFRVEHRGRRVFGTGDGTAPIETRVLEYRWYRPFSASIVIQYESRPEPDYIILNVQPLSKTSSRLFKTVVTPDTSSVLTPQEVEYQRRISAEDQAIVESLPVGIELDAMLMTPWDQPSVEFRKWLAHLYI